MGDVTAIEPSWTFELTVDEEGIVDRIHRLSAIAGYGSQRESEACLEQLLEDRALAQGVGRRVRLSGYGAGSGWSIESCEQPQGSLPAD